MGTSLLIVSAFLNDALRFVVVYDPNSDCLSVVDTAAVCVGSSAVVADDTLKRPADTAGTVGTAVDDTDAGNDAGTAAADTDTSRIAAGTVGTAGSAVDNSAADLAGTAVESADNAAEVTVAGIVFGTAADDTALTAAPTYRSFAPAAVGSKDLVA